MQNQTTIKGLSRFRFAMLMYFMGFLLISIAEVIATSKLMLNSYLLSLIIAGVAIVIIGGAQGQSGLNLLKKENNAFEIAAILGPTGLATDVAGIILILFSLPSLLSISYVVNGTLASGISLPTPIEVGAELYNIFVASNIQILVLGILVLAIGVFCNIFATVIALWRLGSINKKASIKLCALLLWVPTIGLLAFLIAYFEIGKLVSA